MKKLTLALTAIILSTVLASADKNSDLMLKGKADAKKPVNCPSAVADIRVLESEKSHANKKVASGVFSITPVGLFTNAVSSPSESVKIHVDDYNKMIDHKIAEIKKVCHIK